MNQQQFEAVRKVVLQTAEGARQTGDDVIATFIEKILDPDNHRDHDNPDAMLECVASVCSEQGTMYTMLGRIMHSNEEAARGTYLFAVEFAVRVALAMGKAPGGGAIEVSEFRWT